MIVFGTATYLYASNVTSATTNQLTGRMETSQQSLSERVGFESVNFVSSDSSNPSYPPNPSPTLTVYVINSGSVNLQITSAILKVYDSSHNLVGTYPFNIQTGIKSQPQPTFPPSSALDLVYINGVSTVQPLQPGEEGYFVLKLESTLSSLSYGFYSIQIITSNGSSFEYAP